MIKYIIGVVIGISISAAFTIFKLEETRNNWHNQGFNSGAIHAKREIANKLEKEFGTLKAQSKSKYNIIFNVKTTSVVVYESEGNKKIGVIQ
ncbi:hypothetical protein [Spartinivicinus ruber]|uniref:hypothetical protein n=1 Tax=Spartinivicinus ruber TaxID=2683272 RepID=UPI0013D547F2|nr:hypothetical protein [Spartinivicinus ruber]